MSSEFKYFPFPLGILDFSSFPVGQHPTVMLQKKKGGRSFMNNFQIQVEEVQVEISNIFTQSLRETTQKIINIMPEAREYMSTRQCIAVIWKRKQDVMLEYEQMARTKDIPDNILLSARLARDLEISKLEHEYTRLENHAKIQMDCMRVNYNLHEYFRNLIKQLADEKYSWNAMPR